MLLNHCRFLFLHPFLRVVRLCWLLFRLHLRRSVPSGARGRTEADWRRPRPGPIIVEPSSPGPIIVEPSIVVDMSIVEPSIVDDMSEGSPAGRAGGHTISGPSEGRPTTSNREIARPRVDEGLPNHDRARVGPTTTPRGKRFEK
ncbi:hypothetical protein FJT64_000732 [Amphibalanus amphitrite]|uniref:Secreted protein n=1 Tax=Amphibalanus amphitrite TaxID=1232801 RepID=A0A6A4VEE4_AMPAM|nr:hypothetical protein FJT64_000732 [Amphibalanus amphitrite]